MTLEANKKDSAVPDEATLASVSALVHPQPLRRLPIDLNAAISMCNPPNISTNLHHSSLASATVSAWPVHRVADLQQ